MFTTLQPTTLLLGRADLLSVPDLTLHAYARGTTQGAGHLAFITSLLLTLCIL